MIYPIVLYGDPVLKKQARPAIKEDLEGNLIADMFETMHEAEGVGLAAPQIGKSINVFVIDNTLIEENKALRVKKTFINAEILSEEGDLWSFNEGCLSIPGIKESVRRKRRIVVRYRNAQWEEFTETFRGMAARIIQHEHDHIRGVLFTDRLSSLKRRLLKGRLANITKGKAETEYPVKAPFKKMVLQTRR